MQDSDAAYAACFDGDVVFQFGVEGHCALDCLRKDEKGSAERWFIAVSVG